MAPTAIFPLTAWNTIVIGMRNAARFLPSENPRINAMVDAIRASRQDDKLVCKEKKKEKVENFQDRRKIINQFSGYKITANSWMACSGFIIRDMTCLSQPETASK